eukprot:Gregarina_sp_Pseudo_9__2100@NODE_2463_length_988_cov_27_070601_g2266_i0_p1_GENE_NODE_2463_length_988_cov_27_070601_g2266_i0NODE_2463_length_988_cov_27_070601_g2266_i0_p1_ORF_typecomplete_len254_score24_78Peptidase_M50B/PF13398_6/8_7e39DUF4245/PF14030_6/2e02DUF4245/PF14030_6/5_3Rhomboid/PF01694_22/1_1e02Rhomboid/PF01694_22/0_81Rhomboid/PF01694_22/1_1e03TMEM220/PF15071_6/6_5e02TMEM220/PF15071_6/1_1e03TMEM220/PF15071_6/0_66_NODE_2463_length_988_cov_27_070601_g2266_i0123884
MGHDCCCNTLQIVSLATIGASGLICILLWRSVFLAPIKLVVTFLHESSHAIAALLTCGKVTGMEVNENFGGVTYAKGGSRCVTLTAGYIGSVCWGCLFLLLSINETSRLVGAAIFIAACVATPLVLRIRSHRTLMCKCATHIVLWIAIWTLAAIMIAFWVWREMKHPKVDPVQISLLSVGTWCTLHAVYDVTSDTLCHKVDDKTRGQSDAVMLANEICGTPRMWGLIWSLFSLGVLALVIFGLIALDSDGVCT